MDWQMYACIYGEFNKGVVGWINTYEWMDRGKDIQMDVYKDIWVIDGWLPRFYNYMVIWARIT